ncbi:MAG: His/Gly/Thr/Pro-type tRNA ligase C-terminal domain-containing protein, partial [Polyangiales bacterium]
TDYHLKNVNLHRDFEAELGEIRLVREGDKCPSCGEALQLYRGIEGGHIFVLGTHYSAKMHANFLDEQGQQKPFVMGCYGIGVSRLVAAAIEQNNDDNGICWPMAIAPYQVIVTVLGKDDDVRQAAAEMYDKLLELGVEALLDDREERPGVKFKDADLIGIPLRVTVGGRGLEEGNVELKKRTEQSPLKVDVASAANAVRDLVEQMGGALRTR